MVQYLGPSEGLFYSEKWIRFNWCDSPDVWRISEDVGQEKAQSWEPLWTNSHKVLKSVCTSCFAVLLSKQFTKKPPKTHVSNFGSILWPFEGENSFRPPKRSGLQQSRIHACNAKSFTPLWWQVFLWFVASFHFWLEGSSTNTSAILSFCLWFDLVTCAVESRTCASRRASWLGGGSSLSFQEIFSVLFPATAQLFYSQH